MSGGSWDYVHDQIRDVGHRLSADTTNPKRRALGRIFCELSVVMHAIEWADSCDWSQEDAEAAIDKFFAERGGVAAAALREEVELAEHVADRLASLIATARAEMESR